MHCELIWHNPENAQACTIYVRQSTNLEDLSDRPNQYAWLNNNLEKLHRVFSNRVKSLRVPSEDFNVASN